MKIVFDVPDDEVDHALQILADGSFQARHYFPVGSPPRSGGALPGHTRLGAERPRHTFTEAEQADATTAFEGVLARHRLHATVVGVDVWAAGHGGGSAGVREPRRPRPQPVGGMAARAE